MIIKKICTMGRLILSALFGIFACLSSGVVCQGQDTIEKGINNRLNIAINLPDSLAVRPTSSISLAKDNYSLFAYCKVYAVEIIISPITIPNYRSDYERYFMESSKSSRNVGFRSTLKEAINQISAGRVFQITPLEGNLLQRNNVNWGAISSFPTSLGSFRYCTIVGLHRRDVADAIVILYCNSANAADQLGSIALNAVCFTP